MFGKQRDCPSDVSEQMRLNWKTFTQFPERGDRLPVVRSAEKVEEINSLILSFRLLNVNSFSPL